MKLPIAPDCTMVAAGSRTCSPVCVRAGTMIRKPRAGAVVNVRGVSCGYAAEFSSSRSCDHMLAEDAQGAMGYAHPVGRDGCGDDDKILPLVSTDISDRADVLTSRKELATLRHKQHHLESKHVMMLLALQEEQECFEAI